MPTPPLPLSEIVTVDVSVAPAAATAPSFNQGLFIGDSTVIPSYGTNARLRQYGPGGTAALAAMLNDGFTITSPEYIAMQIYFSQATAPTYGWVGEQDATAIQTAVPDGRIVTDGAITTGTDTLTSATADFVSGDVGSDVRVVGAGAAGADLVTTISSVTNSTTAVLAATAGTTVTAADVGIGFVGSGYAVNDTVTVTQSGASYGILTVSAVAQSGMVKTLVTTPGNQGTGYSIATGLSTTTSGSGTGLEVNITAIGETLLQAAEACRAANSTWYGLAVYNPVDADNLALAEWADPLWQTTRYYVWSSDSAIPAGSANNLAIQLQTLKLRVLGIYSTTQGGLYPNNIYAAAGLMGVDMGLNTGAAGSFYTLAHKAIAGIATEPLTTGQYATIVSSGFNAYCNIAPYSVFEPGFMSNGAPSYLWLYLAMLVANMQTDIMNVLTSTNAVTQTNAGQQLLLNATNTACAYLASIGFIAGGTWEGAAILPQYNGLATGAPLPLGYVNLSPPYSSQSAADRDAGKAVPIYSAITTAGAVQSVLINVYTQL